LFSTEAKEGDVLSNRRAVYTPWEDFRSEDFDEAARREKREEEKAEREKLARRKIAEKLLPSWQRRRTPKRKGAVVVDDKLPPVTSAAFSENEEILTLLEDRQKAEIYDRAHRILKAKWRTQGGPQSDNVVDVMREAMRKELTDQARPALVHEWSDFESPYMMKRAALKNIMMTQCVRNKTDEDCVDAALDSRPDLCKLRSKADMPPEVLEPLAAFRGDTKWSFEARQRLQQKVTACMQAIAHIDKGIATEVADSLSSSLPLSKDGTDEHTEETARVSVQGLLFDRVLRHLPENERTEQVEKMHPFRNHFGFRTTVPKEFVGGTRQGQPQRPVEEELENVRYPTLLRVAHNLPRDFKYRNNVMHTIRVLERSRGWDFESKVKAVNQLKEVFESIASSKKYDQILDRGYPVIRRRARQARFTPKRSKWSFGLRWLRSLTLPKPLHLRTCVVGMAKRK